MSTPPDIPALDLEDTPLPTQDLPPRFYEHLAHALDSVDPDVIGAAEAGYRGIFASAHDYILATLAEQLPPDLAWLCDCLDPDRTRERYEAQGLAVWTIRLDDARILAFEAWRRGSGLMYTVPHRDHRLQVFARPPG